MRADKLAVDRIELRNARLGERNKIVAQEASRLWWDKWLRIVFGCSLFALVVYWLTAVLGVVERQHGPDRLSDAVLVALVATTTVNVLGLLYIVARYLSPQPIRNGKVNPRGRTHHRQ